MRIPVPRLYLGTMTFGWGSQTSSVVDEPVAAEMIKHFVNHVDVAGGSEYLIDTARIYAAGTTEGIVGSALDQVRTSTELKGDVVVGTKANPAAAEGDLSASGIDEQIKTSLRELKLSSLGEYYLHQPDTKTTLLESLICTNSMIHKGVISSVGMSNYHAQEMARAFEVCEEYKLTPPTVYQGLYNPLNRIVEEELLPILKANNCAFVAYNPLARFYTDANFEAVEIIRKACEKENISMIEATYRWLLRHSALTEKDGILLGASSISQLDQNLQACEIAATEKGALSSEMLEAFDSAWEKTKSGAFPYWRSYSSDMPNRESLDPGASYTVSKKK